MAWFTLRSGWLCFFLAMNRQNKEVSAEAFPAGAPFLIVYLPAAAASAAFASATCAAVAVTKAMCCRQLPHMHGVEH